ncbi:MAG: polyprenol monophosphomannose synthase [Melioribacteraceae bacterium]|nr:polyprenol monophosphomannose synthase [Melioribacteraceae bacterium]MCF8431720.1 polyprenol monophosphomannose synthase [Melioribacteraceae bacterium]
MKALLIIPTYNELNNIQKLLPAVLDRYPGLDILIVDDNSPDGTADYIRKFMEDSTRVKLIQREKKLGLGTAYVRGFRYVIDHGYDLALQMDADFSHDPNDIARLLEAAKEYDLIIGSRYIQGVNVINWPMQRLLLSFFANKYTSIITGLPINDSTGGFKCFRAEVLKAIDLTKIRSNGYTFQIEMNFKAWKKGFRLKEVPIVFTDRVEGTSKMSKKIVYEAMFMVWYLRFRSILGILR